MDRNGDEGGCQAELAIFITDSTFQIPQIHAILILAIGPTTPEFREVVEVKRCIAVADIVI